MLLHIGLSYCGTTIIRAKIYVGGVSQPIAGATLELKIAHTDSEESTPQIATTTFAIAEHPANNWLQRNVNVNWRSAFRLYGDRSPYKASVSATITSPSGQILYESTAAHIISLQGGVPSVAYPILADESVCFPRPGRESVPKSPLARWWQNSWAWFGMPA